DGADTPLFRRRPERRLLARPERELADHGRVLDAVDRLPQAVGLVAALDLHAAAIFEGPRNRFLYLSFQADAEHDAVDDGLAVGEVLDRGKRDLVPERDRAHHLPALLVRGQAERAPVLGRDVTST